MNFVDVLNTIQEEFSEMYVKKYFYGTEDEKVLSFMKRLNLFSEEILSDKSDLVCVTLDKTDLVCLVLGMSPSYDLMAAFQFYKLGYYTGGFHDKWTWSNEALSHLSVAQLYKVYRVLKEEQLKQEGDS